MKTINFEDIVLIDDNPYINWNSGLFGKIKRCIFDNKIYAYKVFNDEKYLNHRKRKLSELSEIIVPGLILPKYWVKKDKNINAYLTIFEEKDALSTIKDESLKFKALKNAKDLILTMHNNGIIHTDLHGKNILSKDENCSIIDFDDSSYKMYRNYKKNGNYYYKYFVKKYGIIPELDIFMFNLLTYQMVNEINYYEYIQRKVLNDDFGYFNNKDGIKICKSLFSDDKIPNKDFLIDTIDETSFTI